MKILVSGGLGFIGSHFIRYLFDSEHESEVYNIDKMGYGSNPANLSLYSDNPKYHFIRADINDIHELDALPDDIDAIVNIAAETHVDRSISNPEPFIHSNYHGTYSLLEYARRKGTKRFIQVSTDEVYGAAEEGHSFEESDPTNPSNPYSASKAGADLLVQSYFKTYGLNTSITRCTNNFGPNQFPEKLIPKTIISILQGLPIYLYGDGNQIRDWLYVLNHVTAIHTVLSRGRAGETYNISTSNELSNIQLVRKILAIVKERSGKTTEIRFTKDRPGHDKRYSLDSRKIREELHWNPVMDFDRALTQTITWYLDNKEWWTSLVTPSVMSPQPWKLRWDEREEK